MNGEISYFQNRTVDLIEIFKKPYKEMTEEEKEIVQEGETVNGTIAKIYELTNFLAKKDTSIDKKIYGIKYLAILMEPFTPHLAQEIWNIIGEEGLIAEAKWPHINEWDSTKKETIILPIQINGKRKAEISVVPDLTEDAIKDLVLEKEIIKKALQNSDLKRFIYIPKRIVNIVV